MDIVHAAPFRHDNGKTCEDLAEAFLASVTVKSRGYDAVHGNTFDHYDTGISLMQQTRDRRTGEKTSVRHVMCTDSTPVKSNINTFMASPKKQTQPHYISS